MGQLQPNTPPTITIPNEVAINSLVRTNEPLLTSGVNALLNIQAAPPSIPTTGLASVGKFRSFLLFVL